MSAAVTRPTCATCPHVQVYLDENKTPSIWECWRYPKEVATHGSRHCGEHPAMLAWLAKEKQDG